MPRYIRKIQWHIHVHSHVVRIVIYFSVYFRHLHKIVFYPEFTSAFFNQVFLCWFFVSFHRKMQFTVFSLDLFCVFLVFKMILPLFIVVAAAVFFSIFYCIVYYYYYVQSIFYYWYCWLEPLRLVFILCFWWILVFSPNQPFHFNLQQVLYNWIFSLPIPTNHTIYIDFVRLVLKFGWLVQKQCAWLDALKIAQLSIAIAVHTTTQIDFR